MEKLRNFAILLIIPIQFAAIMLMDTAGDSLVLFIGIPLILLLAADLLITRWQLHFKKGETFTDKEFRKRYAFYAVEKILSVFIVKEAYFWIFRAANAYTYDFAWFICVLVLSIVAVIGVFYGYSRAEKTQS